MVFPEIFAAASIDLMPSMLVTSLIPAFGLVSLLKSKAGVAASVPVPQMGQFGTESLSKCVVADARLVTQLVLCQSGELSFSIPKLDPPTTSRYWLGWDGPRRSNSWPRWQTA